MGIELDPYINCSLDYSELAQKAKYAFAEDACGKQYKTKLNKKDIDYFLKQEKCKRIDQA